MKVETLKSKKIIPVPPRWYKSKTLKLANHSFHIALMVTQNLARMEDIGTTVGYSFGFGAFLSYAALFGERFRDVIIQCGPLRLTIDHHKK